MHSRIRSPLLLLLSLFGLTVGIAVAIPNVRHWRQVRTSVRIAHIASALQAYIRAVGCPPSHGPRPARLYRHQLASYSRAGLIYSDCWGHDILLTIQQGSFRLESSGGGNAFAGTSVSSPPRIVFSSSVPGHCGLPADGEVLSLDGGFLSGPFAIAPDLPQRPALPTSLSPSG